MRNSRFKIYLRNSGKLTTLYKIHWNQNGIYFFSHGSADHISYHTDGKYWIGFNGNKLVKKLRQPLNLFKGAETLINSCGFHSEPQQDDPTECSIKIRPEDIVIDPTKTIGIEISISDRMVDLPDIPGRAESIVFQKPFNDLYLIIELFKPTGNSLSAERFPCPIVWVEGENFFYDHQDRI